jgi:hypothetical protein
MAAAGNIWLTVGAVLSAMAALLHAGCILFGTVHIIGIVQTWPWL